MKLLIAVSATLISSACFAQVLSTPAPAPTEEEIRDAHSFCRQTSHFIPPLGTNNTNWVYKPEFAAKCKAIDAEFARLDLAAKAKQKEQMDHLDAVAKKIGK